MNVILEREFALGEISEVASQLAPLLETGKLIGFSGELGAGKTTLIRELLNQLGSKEPVSSPTYALQHIYESQDAPIHHWDLYRLSQVPYELYEERDEVITLIEWPEKDQALSSQLDAVISLQLLDQNTRKITVETRS